MWPITEDIKVPVHYALASDKVRFNGDAVAVVVAETREQAIDAAEAVAVTATELPAVIDLEQAAKDEVLIHDDLGTNSVVHWSHGGAGDQSIFDSAPVIVQERYVQPRLIPNAIEPRGCLAYGVPAMDEWTLVSATQIPHIAKVTLSGVTGIPEQKLRVIAPDVGGGFGSKLNVYAEEALALGLARKLGRPVKWIEGRRENYVATTHGRGVIHDCTIAGTEDGKILGMKFVELADMGAYYQLLTPGIPELGGWVYMGPYDPEAYWYEFTGIVTNTTPTDAYRGAGRPEATYVVERIVDTFARRIGKDPVEVRRMNLKPAFSEATAAISGLSVDSANYEPTFDTALGLVEYDKLRAEQRDRAGAGRHEAARDRPVHLHRDVRPGAVEHPRRAPLRGRWLGRRDDRVPADRQGAGEDRHLAARSGPRDHVGADRGRRARGDARRHRGPARRHADHAARDGHLRVAVGLGRRRGAPLRDGEDQGEGADDRRARARGRPRTTSSGARGPGT